MFRSRAVPLALIGFFVWGTGCYKWVPLDPPYAPLQEEYSELRITQEDGEQVVLEDPRLEADSHLLGTVSNPERVLAIPIDSVQKIEKRDGNNAAGLVIGLVAVAGMIVLLVSQAEGPV